MSIDQAWTIKMVKEFGRKMTVEATMMIYNMSERRANKAIDKALKPTREQIEGTADRLIDGGVVC